MSDTAPRPHEAEFSAGGRKAARDEPGDQPTRAVLLAGVARDARLDPRFVLLVGLSSAIATLGLLQGSAAVVIGAMLVSPLLGPIMGIGFGIATIDSGLIKRSLVTLTAGMVMAALIAVLLVWLSPIRDATAELHARTQPNLFDLGVAVVGGVAAAYAVVRRLSGVMVGVAIATALVPPLSTVGFGLATGRPDFALGAALLFLTNTIAIALAVSVTARLNRFGPSLTPQHTAMQVTGILVTLGLLSIPLALSLDRLARETLARRVVESALKTELAPGDRVDTLGVSIEGGEVRVQGVILVAQYRPDLSQVIEKAAQGNLKRPISASLVQVRQERGSAQDAQRAILERIAALETRYGETGPLEQVLNAGNLIPREQIIIDATARKAVVLRNRASEPPALASAIDRVIQQARETAPDWQIDSTATIEKPTKEGAGG